MFFSFHISRVYLLCLKTFHFQPSAGGMFGEGLKRGEGTPEDRRKKELAQAVYCLLGIQVTKNQNSFLGVVAAPAP